MFRAHALRDMTTDQVVRRLVGEGRDTGREQRRRHQRSLPAALAFEQGEEQTFLELVRE